MSGEEALLYITWSSKKILYGLQRRHSIGQKKEDRRIATSRKGTVSFSIFHDQYIHILRDF